MSEPEETSEIVAAEQLLSRALGGWRGLVDSGLPTVAFLVAWTVTGSKLQLATIVAVSIAGGLALIRLLQRRSLQQVFSGLLGVALAAWVANKTGKAEDYFLPGLLTNVAYGVGIAISIVVKHPAVGYVIGALKGDFGGWRQDPQQLRLYRLVSWWWVGMFGFRLLVQVPLYLAGATQWLGAVKLIMGWPLYLAVAYVTYLAVTGKNQPAADDSAD